MTLYAVRLSFSYLKLSALVFQSAYYLQNQTRLPHGQGLGHAVQLDTKVKKSGFKGI